MAGDLDVLKDIPGYRTILKAVLKSQIQFLVEQLSDHVGDDCIVLTANALEGSITHLGSTKGKTFLDNHTDVKSMFLGYCINGDRFDEALNNSDIITDYSHPNHPADNDLHAHDSTFLNSESNSRKRQKTGGKKIYSDSGPYKHDAAIKKSRKNNYTFLNYGQTEMTNGHDTAISVKDKATPPDDTLDLEQSRPKMFRQEETGTELLTVIKTEDEEEGYQDLVEDQGSNSKDFTTISPESSASRLMNTSHDVPHDFSAAAQKNLTQPLDFLSHLTSSISDSSFQPQFSHSQPLDFTSVSSIDDIDNHIFSSQVADLPGHSKSFDDKDNKYRHDKSVFTCDVCNRAFNRKYNMVQHRMLHFGVKQFSCEVCDKQFTRQDRLKFHQLKHHSDGKYEQLIGSNNIK